MIFYRLQSYDLVSNICGGWEIFLCFVNCVMNSMVGWNVGQFVDVIVYLYFLYLILSLNEVFIFKGYKFDLVLFVM